MTGELPTADQKTPPFVETRLRVASWNVWWRYGPWEAREGAILETLKRLDADVVCLQEVWQNGAEIQVARFADALGLEAVFDVTQHRHAMGFGNAVLSRWPIAGRKVRPLPLPTNENAAEHGRNALMADIRGPRGDLSVTVTHLSWRQHDGAARQAQVRELCRFVAAEARATVPPIVCGDFNANPAAEEVRMMTGDAAVPVEGLCFHDAWVVAGDGGPGYTWDNCNDFAARALEPDRRIDYVFVGGVGPRGEGHVTSCRVIGDAPVGGLFPSDHFGLLAEIRY